VILLVFKTQLRLPNQGLPGSQTLEQLSPPGPVDPLAICLIMSAEPNPIIEVRGLADALFDGNLDAAGVARLESLIDNSTACLNAYVERIDLHGELLDQADPHSNAQAALMVLTDFTDACTARAARNAYRLYAFSAAATLAVCCLTGWLFWSDILKPVPLGSIAHMTSDTRASSGTLELGQVVRAGSTLSVKSGVLSIELPHVMLDLLGPARLKLNDLHRVELQKGTLTVRVGPGGEGFTVRTADAEVVDFGTEFSVKYDSGQGTAVSVRHGRVRSSLLDHENVSSKVLELTANRAARLQRGTATLSEVVFQPEAFEQVDRARGKFTLSPDRSEPPPTPLLPCSANRPRPRITFWSSLNSKMSSCRRIW